MRGAAPSASNEPVAKIGWRCAGFAVRGSYIGQMIALRNVGGVRIVVQARSIPAENGVLDGAGGSGSNSQELFTAGYWFSRTWFLGGAKHGIQRCKLSVHVGWTDDHVRRLLSSLVGHPASRWSEVVTA